MEYAKYQRAQGEIIREKETAVRNKQNELLSTKAQKNQLLAAGRTEQTKLEGQQKEREGIVSELKKDNQSCKAPSPRPGNVTIR